MAQPAEDDDAQTSHVVIDVVVDTAAEPAASTRCCCVCTEPLEWVAVGRCCHRDVCAGCAIRIRFFQGDHRCCVCRMYCPSVIVTRLDRRLDDLPFFRPRGRVGGPYWHHGGLGAYFDDQDQYEMATKFCAKPPPRPRPRPADLEINVFETPVNRQLDDAPSRQQRPGGVVYRRNGDEPLSEGCLFVIFIGIYLCVILLLVIMSGVLFFLAAETSNQKVAVVIVFGLLSAAATIYAIWSWPKFKTTLLNC